MPTSPSSTAPTLRDIDPRADRNVARPAAGRERLEALTSLRFFAALHVVLYHYAPFVDLPALVQHFLRYGYVGVSVFFVLSGFVLAYSYGSIETLAECRRFWLARLARIYPAYLLALVLSLPIFLFHLQRAEGASSLTAIGQITLEAFLLHAWSPLTACGVNCPGWSLSVEAFFYLMFPLIVPRLRRMSDRGLISAATNAWTIAVLVPAIYLIALQQREVFAGPSPLLLTATIYTPLFHLPQFVIGVATGLLFVRHRGEDSTRLAQIAFVGAVLLIILLMTSDLAYPLVNNGLFAPVFAVIIYVLAGARGMVSGWLQHGTLRELGEASYATYILQYPLAGWFAFATTGQWQARFDTVTQLTAFVVVLVAASLASFRWIETPARRSILRLGARAS